MFHPENLASLCTIQKTTHRGCRHTHRVKKLILILLILISGSILTGTDEIRCVPCDIPSIIQFSKHHAEHFSKIKNPESKLYLVISSP